MRDALVLALEGSPSFAASKSVVAKMEQVEYFNGEQLTRIEAACKDNDQVANSFGVPERILKIVQRFRPPPAADPAF